MKPIELVVKEPNEIDYKSYRERRLKPNQVRAEAFVSGISHGTELNLFKGTAPFYDKIFDMKNRLFLKGENFTSYPIKLGYEWVGRVVDIGENVKKFKKGDLVHLPLGHRTSHTFFEDMETMYGKIEPLPEKFNTNQAIFLALAGVALQAVHDAHIKLGDRVIIFGLGTLGLLILQLARLNGALWIDAVDPIPKRRTLAERLGANKTYDPTDCDIGMELKTKGSNDGADIAIEASGNYKALHDAIRSVKMAGTVVAAGFYQGNAEGLRLGEEWHHNRITLYSSMGVWGCPHRDYPNWDRDRIHNVVVKLFQENKLRIENFITHRIPIQNAQEAYELINKNPEEVIKVVLTYDKD
ncbi:MAG: zinc-binding dehydrogenase [Candidatus Lokiarchaeota archaeon]|nr:zinc-binding dehydrogenase [Candidatus Lokiarchaeota archaeon]MBD3339641.1 zinc-binding dehydrogenase [Candidatus Lokiarchaeota archaeon]